MEASGLVGKENELSTRPAGDKLRMTEDEFASFMNNIAPGTVVSIDFVERSGI